ncbi:MAG TPA: 4-hydroxythreonine-4-phosphate dehydrogenase PdxA [Longimicrobiales bacterium]|nr:4-hydroxythreonine-4-phosphate dehydrogenase PdxA [Longimicrobiales bacterium]
MSQPHVAVTLGDPRGIGPEVALRAIEAFRDRPDVALSVVTPEGTFTGPDIELARSDYARRRTVTDLEAGEVCAASIERATEGALSGRFQALVTAPVHKPSLHAAGYNVPGQTEMLGRLAGADRVGMLMAAERTRLGAPLRVLLATTHLPLRDVPDAVTERLLVEQTELLEVALRRDWGIAEPRLALCALNPHASDGGLFGDEEDAIFAPAVSWLRSDGVSVDGPIPADTVFSRALAGDFDAVVAPYHDVGMAAFKTVSFGTGVNVTLGLPFVRTSPDHGTAFALAGTGRADPSSMREALELGARLARARFDTVSVRV